MKYRVLIEFKTPAKMTFKRVSADVEGILLEFYDEVKITSLEEFVKDEGEVKTG